MNISSICKDYFTAFQKIPNWKNSDNKTKALVALSVISYFTLIIPMCFMVAYGVSSLFGRAQKKDVLDQNEGKINGKAQEVLRKKRALTPYEKKAEELSRSLNAILDQYFSKGGWTGMSYETEYTFKYLNEALKNYVNKRPDTEFTFTNNWFAIPSIAKTEETIVHSETFDAAKGRALLEEKMKLLENAIDRETNTEGCKKLLEISNEIILFLSENHPYSLHKLVKLLSNDLEPIFNEAMNVSHGITGYYSDTEHVFRNLNTALKLYAENQSLSQKFQPTSASGHGATDCPDTVGATFKEAIDPDKGLTKQIKKIESTAEAPIEHKKLAEIGNDILLVLLCLKWKI